MAAGSVMKGSTVLIVGRVVGMLGGFVLMLLLTWQSSEMAGIFRTIITYLTILDFVPLLGMHRWIATQITRRGGEGHAVFTLACWFAIGVSIVTGMAFLAIALAGAYDSDTSSCLRIAALAALPSAINLCSASALVGLGHTHQSGLVSLLEMLTRSSLAIILVVLGIDLTWVIAVYVGSRWFFAGAGLYLVRTHIGQMPARVDRSLAREFLSQVPNLALSMIGFLVMRNAAMVLLPLFRGAAETGYYAAPLQFFDLLMLVPTVLTISTNHAFSESASRSSASLRQNTMRLIYITAIFVVPAVLLGLVLAGPMILTVYGSAYEASIVPFRLILLCVAVASLDQILALSMVVSGGFKTDRICMSAGAVTVVVAICLLGGGWGAIGAAAAVLLGSICTLGIRLFFMRRLIRVRPLLESTRRQTIAALIAGAVVAIALPWTSLGGHFKLFFDILLGLFGCLIYLAIFYWSGGLNQKRIRMIRSFMARRG